MADATPLQWPIGWARTPRAQREDSKYRFQRTGRYLAGPTSVWTFADARDTLLDELKRLGATHPIISSDYPTDRYGMPTERGRRPDDNGVALYFSLKGKQTVMACDMHLRAEENMRSLALSIEAMRALARHGGGTMMSRAFEGFAKIEAPGAKHWSLVLEVSCTASHAEITSAFLRLARERHPDQGGSDAMMAELNIARDAALLETAR